jgi:hypothetical protein
LLGSLALAGMASEAREAGEKAVSSGATLSRRKKPVSGCRAMSAVSETVRLPNGVMTVLCFA